MVVFGVDAHKRCHTIVAAGQNGRKLAGRTIGTASADPLALLRWAASLGRQPGRRAEVGAGGRCGCCTSLLRPYPVVDA